MVKKMMISAVLLLAFSVALWPKPKQAPKAAATHVVRVESRQPEELEPKTAVVYPEAVKTMVGFIIAARSQAVLDLIDEEMFAREGVETRQSAEEWLVTDFAEMVSDAYWYGAKPQEIGRRLDRMVALSESGAYRFKDVAELKLEIERMRQKYATTAAAAH